MSQTEAILKHLKSGKSITPLEALSEYGVFRLGARIYDLQRMGYNISRKLITSNGKRFACYTMEGA